MIRSTDLHILRLLSCILLIVFTHAGFDWYFNQAQYAGEDIPTGKLMSLSFAPYREGFSPLEEIFPLPEQIDQDLQLLADKTETVRTYSSLGGMQPTPELARKYGLKMIQGCWLGNVLKDNRKEIQAVIESANANPDVVTRIIVGNEVLLRKDMDIDRLIGYIREVKKAVKQPVSYADVWSIYMHYPQLINEVDFITVHILPYWEDEPIAVENAAQHLEKIVKQVDDEARGIAPGKKILIGESGWPSAGRQRGLAVPNVVNEAKFIRSMVDVANRHGFDYNIVEAFNQPWKSNLEGVVGANWGLLSVDREAVFPLTGPVSENPNWKIQFIFATALFIVFATVYSKKLLCLNLIRLLVLLSLAQIFSICLVNLAEFLWKTSYSNWQRGYTLTLIFTNSVLAGLLMQRSYFILANNPIKKTLSQQLRTVYLIFFALAIYKTYYLAFNGRYLSFPIEQFLIPVIGIFALFCCLCISKQQFALSNMSLDNLFGWNLHNIKDKLLAYFLSIGLLSMIVGETKAFMNGADFILAHPTFSEGLPFALSYTLQNKQLLGWLVCLFVLALPLWLNSNIAKPRGKLAKNSL